MNACSLTGHLKTKTSHLHPTYQAHISLLEEKNGYPLFDTTKPFQQPHSFIKNNFKSITINPSHTPHHTVFLPLDSHTHTSSIVFSTPQTPSRRAVLEGTETPWIRLKVKTNVL
jgi:hypothetical protein